MHKTIQPTLSLSESRVSINLMIQDIIKRSIGNRGRHVVIKHISMSGRSLKAVSTFFVISYAMRVCCTQKYNQAMSVTQNVRSLYGHDKPYIAEIKVWSTL